jgi:hypothetical protein
LYTDPLSFHRQTYVHVNVTVHKQAKKRLTWFLVSLEVPGVILITGEFGMPEIVEKVKVNSCPREDGERWGGRGGE